MATINPYLIFSGNAEEAFNFYKTVFGGEFKVLQRFKDTPDADKIPESEKEKIMHVALPIGIGDLLMGSDVPESMGRPVQVGNNIHIAVNTGSKDEADRLFIELAAGGSMEMPMQDVFWGAYFGMCRDRFGIQWMVSYEHHRPA